MTGKRFFITSSGTGVGKTLVTCALAYQLQQQGKKVQVQKPIVTGWDEADPDTDTALLLHSVGLPHTVPNIQATSPWRFVAALSPHLAAEAENTRIDTDAVVAFSRHAEVDYLLVEGVGGVMVPLTYDYHSLHWMQALQFSVILVVGSYLGAISHALTAIVALQVHDIHLSGIIVSESESSTVPLPATIRTLQGFVDVPVLALPRITVDADHEIWQLAAKMLPEIDKIFI
jgi:dethiobiotin synthetase